MAPVSQTRGSSKIWILAALGFLFQVIALPVHGLQHGLPAAATAQKHVSLRSSDLPGPSESTGACVVCASAAGQGFSSVPADGISRTPEVARSFVAVGFVHAPTVFT